MSISDNDFNNLSKDVKEILHILNGNGKVGLCAKVDLMWGWGVFVAIGVGGIILKELVSFLNK